MLESKLKFFRSQFNNIIVLSLACAAIAPLTTLHRMANVGRTESLIAIFCLTYWGLRKLKQTIVSVFYQQDTLYLWALHTFSRLETQKSKNWLNYIRDTFHQKHYLVIGNKQSGKSTLLKNAGANEQQVPFEYQQKGLISHTIWTFQRHIFLESTSLMPHNEETRQLQKKYWKNLVNINRWSNTASGFDGLMVVISIHNILHEKKAHPTQSIDALRSQIQNITRVSRDIPIFIVLTGLDFLPGFRTFFKNIDKDDVNKPLGFVIPRELQFSSDIQNELDKVANDIEMYLIYQLEKIIHGDDNDVEKMHVFHENFKLLKPKLVQILYSFTTHIKNPIASILFTSFCEKEEFTDHSNLPQVENFYETTSKSFFNNKILTTINEHVFWQPSTKLQQYALLLVGFFAWNVSELSISENLVAPIQSSINYLYRSEKSRVLQPSPAPTTEHQAEYVNNQPLNYQESTQVASHISSTVSDEQQSTNPTKKNQIDTNILDLIKQTVLTKIPYCDITKHLGCYQLADILISTKQAKEFSSKQIELFGQMNEKFKYFPEASLRKPIALDDANIIEIGELIEKLKDNQPKTSFDKATWTLMHQLYPKFDQLTTAEKIKDALPIATNTCQHFDKVSSALPLNAPSAIDCIQTLHSRINNQLFEAKLQIYQQSLKNYHNDKTVDSFLRKAIYLHDNTHIISSSMEKIAAGLHQMEEKKSLLSSTHQRKLFDTLNQAENFSEKNYKSVLAKIIHLSKEITQSENQDRTTLQVLSTLTNDSNIWPKSWDQLDQFSKDCILSYEQVIINSAGKYLNERWKKDIYDVHTKRIKHFYPFNEHSQTSISLDAFDEFFSPQGTVNTFIAENLQSLIEIDQDKGPRWKKLRGSELPFSQYISSFIMGANIIQKMYYANNTPTLWFEGVLRYRYASNKIKSIEIIQDGNKQTINTKQTAPIHVKWPHATELFVISVNLENGENVVVQKEEGPWSMIKLLCKAKHHKHDKKSHILTFKHYDITFELEFESQNSINPLSAKIHTILQIPKKIFLASEE